MTLNTTTKLLWFGDLERGLSPAGPFVSGFGRIGNEVTRRLHLRGWQIIGASVPWTGYPPQTLPFYLWGMGGVDLWNRLTAMVAENKPDIVVVCQDYPYAQTALDGCRIDWSITKLVIVTPIDGTPVHPEWVRTSQRADATCVISQFGVDALREAGVKAHLLHPGVDRNEFTPADPAERAALRARLNLPPDAFVIGSFMMNQGRKAVPETVELFYEFAKDKPHARLYLDMDKASPAGWDIPTLLRQIEPSPRVLVEGQTVLYREHALAAGLAALRERYALCDLSAQLAHREGFGLPNLESQAMRVPPLVLDWCSGPEIAGEGKGVLVKRLPYLSRGTWGGARDAFPDMPDALAQLARVHDNRDELARLASAGYEWAVSKTWEAAADTMEQVLREVALQQRQEREAHEPAPVINIPAPGLSDVRGPAHPEHRDTSVQLPPGGDALPGVDGGNGRLQPDGSARQRRSVVRLRSDAPAAPVASEAVPE